MSSRKKDGNNESGYAGDTAPTKYKKKTDYLNTFKELTACNERESKSLMGLSNRCAVEILKHAKIEV